jgi:hypothetical protein
MPKHKASVAHVRYPAACTAPTCRKPKQSVGFPATLQYGNQGLHVLQMLGLFAGWPPHTSGLAIPHNSILNLQHVNARYFVALTA